MEDHIDPRVDLRASEARLRTALQAGKMGSWVWDTQANRSFWNTQEYELLGLPPGDGTVDTAVFFRHVHPDDLPELQRQLAQVLEQGTQFEHEFRIIRADGQTRWLAGRGCVIREEQTGQPLQMFGVNYDVTERKQAEEVLRRGEEKFRALVEVSAQIVRTADATGAVQEDSPSWRAFTGQTFDQWKGWGWLDVIHPEDRERAASIWRRAVAERTPYETEYRIRHAAGGWRWMAVRAVPLLDAAGAVQGWVGMDTDISERKQAEEALRHSEGQLRLALDQLQIRLQQQEAVAQLGMTAMSTSDLSVLLNRAVDAVSHVLGTELCKVLELQADGRALLRAGVGWSEGLVGRATVSAGRESQAGYTLLSSAPVIVDDLRSETRFSGPPLLHEHGVVSGLSVTIPGSERPYGVLGAHTQQRRAFSKDDVNFVQCVANVLAGFIERRRMETQYRQLVESTEDYAILTLDPAGTITTWNRGAERMTGFQAAEVIGRPVTMFYPVEERSSGKPAQDLAETLTRGKTQQEGWRLRRDGSRFLANCITLALRDDHGNPSGFSRIVRDLTAQRREEEALRSAVDHSNDAVVTIDEHGIIQACSGAFQKVLGYSVTELVGQNVRVLMPEPWRGEHDQYIRSYLQTGTAKIIGRPRELSGLRKDGATIPLELAVTEFRLDAARFFTGILRDISGRRNLEAQLRQAQKMEAVGQLAGGVAHDFNNLLTIITGYSEILLSRLPQQDPLRTSATAIREAAERATSLTRQLLAFSRQTVLTPVVLDLNAVVSETEKMLRRLIGEDILLTTVLDPKISPVKVDPGQLGQVLMNLAVNARDAMPKGGKLTIETANVEFDQEYAAAHPDLKPGPYVRLTMADAGSGMAPEVTEHIFEPFFTTKDVGQGTGLGLAVVHGIIKQSGGHIEVQSELGRGTTFKIYLPAVAEPFAASIGLDTGKGLSGTETILLVEDEDSVRELATLALQTHGYKVLAASEGREALRVLEQHRGPIDLLLTDVVMPAMDGRDLAEALRPQFPHMRVLYTSGYTDDAVVRHGILHEEVAFLQKPFSPLSLAIKVREVLDRKE